MKNNKHGMTLVECIIAMAVFAVASTGFIMTATACYKSQVKAKKRMDTANTQTTNLEHFSNYSQVVDPEALNVEPMSGGSNRWVITFPFTSASGGEISNSKVHGYYSVADPDDPVFDLSFFSPIEQVDLTTDEYWVTFTNVGSEQKWLELSLADSTHFVFFDNEKNEASGSTLPEHIWGPNGGAFRFGIKNKGGGDISGAVLTVHDVQTDQDIGTYTISDFILPDDNGSVDTSKGYCAYYINGDSVINETTLNAQTEE